MAAVTTFKILWYNGGGGCFYDGAGWCSTPVRYPNEPLLAADYIGFRVARVVEEEVTDGAS